MKDSIPNLYWKSFIDTIFPRECIGCRVILSEMEEQLCTFCISDLPISFHFEIRDNPVYQAFKGRVNMVGAYSFLHFRPESLTQKLMHELKYNNNQEVGKLIGKLFGKYFKLQNVHPIPDIIIPVPLHPDKFKKRGFNQSEIIARAFGDEIEAETNPNLITRKIANDTQTNKNRAERWQNVEQIFDINPDFNFQGKHFLIFDDVITTGATIESCASVLDSLTCNIKISIASIAYTS